MLPFGFSNCPNLDFIEIYAPNMVFISSDFFELQKLTSLHIIQSQIENIPNQISNFKQLESLNLGVINASGNYKKLFDYPKIYDICLYETDTTRVHKNQGGFKLSRIRRNRINKIVNDKKESRILP